MNVSSALRLLAAGGLVACSGNGPPRPDGVAPFPMPNPPASGLPNPQSYRTSAEGLVLDEVTGLEWQGGVDRSSTDSSGFTWQDAVDHCDELEQGGYDDFRLPNRIELVSILDPSTTEPAIDEDAFPETPAETYWTGTSVASDPELSAYSASLVVGDTGSSLKTEERAVRCVRDARQPPLPAPGDRFRIEGGTALDRQTGLRWEHHPTLAADTLEKARAYCGALIVNGNANFRVPSVKELQTIVDDTKTSGPLLDPVAFPEAPGGTYWSSTRFAGEPEEPPDGGSPEVLAWSVRFSDGHSRTEDDDTENRVRCVR
ncbi:MAG TPA: DUF1566 domain-containing protein [Polyangiaceae bacterium]